MLVLKSFVPIAREKAETLADVAVPSLEAQLLALWVLKLFAAQRAGTVARGVDLAPGLGPDPAVDPVNRDADASTTDPSLAPNPARDNSADLLLLPQSVHLLDTPSRIVERATRRSSSTTDRHAVRAPGAAEEAPTPPPLVI